MFEILQIYMRLGRKKSKGYFYKDFLDFLGWQNYFSEKMNTDIPEG